MMQPECTGKEKAIQDCPFPGYWRANCRHEEDVVSCGQQTALAQHCANLI